MTFYGYEVFGHWMIMYVNYIRLCFTLNSSIWLCITLNVWSYMITFYDCMPLYYLFYDLVLRCVTLWYSAWLCMILYDPFLHCMNMFGSFWLNWLLLYSLWPCMTLNAPKLLFWNQFLFTLLDSIWICLACFDSNWFWFSMVDLD